MEVSKLEVKGFKSFGDRIIIHFDSGITGIVGPNGCGKSNIVDAIRWVLGEQKTRALRSDKMENVIFNGSKRRQPLQMAEVSLTFNNTRNLLPTAYSEVTVTRRYYRTGDSEYLLNNVPCRLKDINDLFLDTGIGPDSYAIIELKMVDEILNDKENSRRNLFEEATGISKFKVRKKQALKKLEETSADLERVEDVLFEINKNLKSLERQAKISERYTRLKEEYRTLSVEFARRNIGFHQQSLEKLEHDLQQENQQKSEVSGQIQALEESLQDQKQQLDRTQAQLSTTQKTANEQTTRLRQLENEIKLKNERVFFLRERVTTLLQQISQDNANLEHTQSNISQLQTELTDVREQYGFSEEQVEVLKQEVQQASLRKNELQTGHGSLQARQRSLQNEIFQLNKSIEIAEVQIRNLETELEKLEAQHLSEAESGNQFEAQLAEAHEDLEAKVQELKNLQAEEEELKQTIQNTENEMQLQKANLGELNRTLDARKNQYSLTKSLVDNLEGFPDAIKFLYKSPNWQNPAPLLSDLMVCQQAYKQVIESFLEPYLNFFVVDTTADALEAIQLLNNQNKGRANFIILSEIEELDVQPTETDGKLLAALEVVSADEKYGRLLQYMLNEVYIPLDTTAPTFYPGDHRTFILRDGSVIKKPLSVSGGSVGLFDGNRIGRKQNLENLAKEISTLTDEADLLKSKINTLQQVLLTLKESTRQETIRQAERQISVLNQELYALRLRHEQHLLNQQNHFSKKEELLERLQEQRDARNECLPQVADRTAALEQLEEQMEAQAQALQQQSELVAEITAIYNQENIKYHQFRNRLSSVEQEIAYRRKSLEANQQRIQNLQEELNRSKEEIKGSEGFMDENQELLEQLTYERQETGTQLEAVEKQYFSLRGDIDGAEKNLRELQRKKQNADDIFLAMHQAINETRIKLVAIKERLSAEFNLHVEDLGRASEPLDLPDQELIQQVQDVKNRLDNIGPVNPMAAEAYTEIFERNRFILEQRDDLLSAKNTLLATIAEIDTVAKEKFLRSFEQIQQNFLRVFRSLFTEEDTCSLVIADPENPLESKIEIMARPKGKRPLTINQLSGGEKTLTAISLLFAIYLLKPAPFCIFDEVDAPLDDANIDKFNQIVKKFSGESQFIVVTHNKRTMAATDVMYGITMLEPGVSKVLPVDLRAMAS
jgi:chromosome segregation protein